MADIELATALGTLGYTSPFTGTWATRPAASSSAGRYAFFTMPDGRKVAMVSDGARWRPVHSYAVLQPNASVTGTLTETTLATVSLPGTLLGSDGAVRITAIFGFTGTAGIKTMRAKFGGVTFVNSGPAVSTLSASINRTIANLTASSQIAIPVTAAEGSALASSVVTGAVDTTVDQPLVITVQLANVADSATLYKLIVEVL